MSFYLTCYLVNFKQNLKECKLNHIINSFRYYLIKMKVKILQIKNVSYVRIMAS